MYFLKSWDIDVEKRQCHSKMCYISLWFWVDSTCYNYIFVYISVISLQSVLLCRHVHSSKCKASVCSPCGHWGLMHPRRNCRFRRYIGCCLCVCFPFYFFLLLLVTYFFSYLYFTSLISFPLWTALLCFQAGCCRRRLNLGLFYVVVFWWFADFYLIHLVFMYLV